MKTDGIFVKLMMLTTSSSDAEALTALRKANKILADAKVSWMELLGGIKQDQSYRVPPSKRPRRSEPNWEDVGDDEKFSGPEIDQYFNTVFDKTHSESFGSFLESLHIWWEQHGWLSKKQYRALKNAAEK